MNKNISPFQSPKRPERLCHLSNPSQDYLEAEMPSPQHTQITAKGEMRGFRQAILVREGRLLEKNVQYRKRKKQLLIIENKNTDEQIFKKSRSIAWKKNKTEPCQSLFVSCSSQKKTIPHDLFEVAAPPKKHSKWSKEKCKQEDSKCQLIKAILRRYKEQYQADQPEEVSSPCISSVKLKQRMLLPATHSKFCHLKSKPKKGLPNRLSKQYLVHKEGVESRPGCLVVQKEGEDNAMQISPWDSDEKV